VTLLSKTLELTGKQKTAILLLSLGSDISAGILKHLREDEIEEITLEIANLKRVPPELRDQVIEEFHQICLAQEYILSGGIEMAREILDKALGTHKAYDVIEKLTSSLTVRPFDFARKTEPSQLLNFIQNEHPQTIALILSYLDSQQGLPSFLARFLPISKRSRKKLNGIFKDKFKVCLVR